MRGVQDCYLVKLPVDQEISRLLKEIEMDFLLPPSSHASQTSSVPTSSPSPESADTKVKTQETNTIDEELYTNRVFTPQSAPIPSTTPRKFPITKWVTAGLVGFGVLLCGSYFITLGHQQPEGLQFVETVPVRLPMLHLFETDTIDSFALPEKGVVSKQQIAYEPLDERVLPEGQVVEGTKCACLQRFKEQLAEKLLERDLALQTVLAKASDAQALAVQRGEPQWLHGVLYSDLEFQRALLILNSQLACWIEEQRELLKAEGISEPLFALELSQQNAAGFDRGWGQLLASLNDKQDLFEQSCELIMQSADLQEAANEVVKAHNQLVALRTDPTASLVVDIGKCHERYTQSVQKALERLLEERIGGPSSELRPQDEISLAIIKGLVPAVSMERWDLWCRACEKGADSQREANISQELTQELNQELAAKKPKDYKAYPRNFPPYTADMIDQEEDEESGFLLQ